MGSKRATDQVHNDSQTIVKYPIRVTVRFRFRVRVSQWDEHGVGKLISQSGQSVGDGF